MASPRFRAHFSEFSIIIGNSLRTNRDYLFAVYGGSSIFAPTKVILNFYDYETDSIFIQVAYVGDNDGMDVDESSPEV
jgi:hypothetical protein